MRRQGFTMVELLVVIGILGILLAIGIPNYVRWTASMEVRSAAVNLAQQIVRIRTEAKRGSTVTLSTTTGSSAVTVGSRTVTLSGATVQTTGSLSFRAPYGTLEGGVTPQEFTLRSTRNSSLTRTVRVVSLMGKVVVQ